MKLNEIAGNLDRFADIHGSYANYKYGEPQEAAKLLVDRLKKVKTALSGVKRDIDKAGGALSPAVSNAFMDDLMRTIRTELKISTIDARFR